MVDCLAWAIFKSVEAAVSYGTKMNVDKWLFLDVVSVVKQALNDCFQTPKRKNVKRKLLANTIYDKLHYLF